MRGAQGAPQGPLRGSLALKGDGSLNWDGELEEEANWLAGALLISEEAALNIVRNGLTEDQAINVYRVSRPMLRFRINVTGARTRVARKVGIASTGTAMPTT